MTYVTAIERVPGSRWARGRTRANAKPRSETMSVSRSTVRSIADWSKVVPGTVSSSLLRDCGSTPAKLDSMSTLPKVKSSPSSMTKVMLKPEPSVPARRRGNNAQSA